MENEIWSKSLKRDSWSLDSNFPFVHHLTRPPREFGLAAYRNDRDGSLVIDRLYPGLNPNTGKSDMIALPKRILETGRFTKPGYTLVLIEHSHPIAYSFGNQIGSGYVRGPSQPDFNTSYANPEAYSVVQALGPQGERQFFNYGPRLYQKKERAR